MVFLGECPLNLFIIMKGSVIALGKSIYRESQPKEKRLLISESQNYFDSKMTTKNINAPSSTKISIRERDSLSESLKNFSKKREYHPLKLGLVYSNSPKAKLFNDKIIYPRYNSKNDIKLNRLTLSREDNENAFVKFEKDIQRMYPKMKIKYHLSVGHCLGDLSLVKHRGR